MTIQSWHRAILRKWVFQFVPDRRFWLKSGCSRWFGRILSALVVLVTEYGAGSGIFDGSANWKPSQSAVCRYSPQGNVEQEFHYRCSQLRPSRLGGTTHWQGDDATSSLQHFACTKLYSFNF